MSLLKRPEIAHQLDAKDPLRCFGNSLAERGGDPRAQGLMRRIDIELHLSAEEAVRAQAA